jgi:Mg-chelatase subunit ChlD
MKKQTWAVVLLLTLIASTADSIRCQDDEEITIETESVLTTLRASNRKNKPVAVKKDDIRVYLDGRQQDISYFAVNQVNRFVILLDASASMRGRRFHRSVKFINELAENSLPGQSFDVFVFAEQTEFIGTMTKKDKRDVLDRLRNFSPRGETALYESVVHTLYEFDKNSEASALIVVTDGEDNLSTDSIKQEADKLLGQFGTMTYLVVLGTRSAFRNPEMFSRDRAAEQAIKSFQKILQPVAFIAEFDIELNRLADRLPREAGFLVRVGFDPEEIAKSDSGLHTLEIVHRDTNLNLSYRRTILMK